MNKPGLWICCTFALLSCSLGGLLISQRLTRAGGAKDDDIAKIEFESLVDAEWSDVFFDSGQKDWHEKWFLDGLEATIHHSDRGMDFYAGPKAGDDAHHAVLWTKQSFKGDVKIEYEYTRLDQATKFVNILYIQATGSGQEPYVEDIEAWKGLREKPAMSQYFSHMNTYHISYAAFGNSQSDRRGDYIRARRYLPLARKGLAGTALRTKNSSTEYSNTHFFKPNVPYKITVIKEKQNLYMQVIDDEREMLYHWVNESLPSIQKGRVGLRHMFTRGARYKNFRISELRSY